MDDIKQELAGVQAATQQIEAQLPEPAPTTPPAPGKVRLRHPFTGDTKDVDAAPADLVPLMGLGYQQVKG